MKYLAFRKLMHGDRYQGEETVFTSFSIVPGKPELWNGRHEMQKMWSPAYGPQGSVPIGLGAIDQTNRTGC